MVQLKLRASSYVNKPLKP